MLSGSNVEYVTNYYHYEINKLCIENGITKEYFIETNLLFFLGLFSGLDKSIECFTICVVRYFPSKKTFRPIQYTNHINTLPLIKLLRL